MASTNQGFSHHSFSLVALVYPAATQEEKSFAQYLLHLAGPLALDGRGRRSKLPPLQQIR
jgi:hypothetical protein